MAGNNQLFYFMQLAGGTFPSGGFSQSWGLETYVVQGKIKTAEEFLDFLEVYLYSTIALCEGPILCESYRLAENWEEEKILQLEEFSCAVKVTKESRESSVRMGKAFLRIASSIFEEEEIRSLSKRLMGSGVSYPVIYGAVCGKLRLDIKETVEAFVFSAVNGLVQSAIKLIPLGNTEAQKVLLDMQEVMSQTAEKSLALDIEDVSNFCPGIDMASMAHETLPVRLYMS